TISWSGIPLTGNVKILLYLGTKAVKAPVTASAPNVGSFEWVVPGTLAAGTYKLKVVWLSKPTLPDNGATFDVTETTGPITVTQPAGGAEVRQGSVQQVAWSGLPPTGNVKILLYLGTKVVKAPVSASTLNNGLFNWVVPGNLATGTYTMQVVWLSNPKVSGLSAPFTVVGP
ncbi:MAG: hypothetical protein ACYC9Y_05080, partial [Candidatus Methylomirabilia bacterium]